MKKSSFLNLQLLVLIYVITQPFFGFSLMNIEGRGVARLDWVGIFLLASGFAVSLYFGRSHFRYSPVNKFVWIFIGTVFLSLLSMFNASTAQFIDFGTKGFALFACLVAYFTISSISMDDRRIKLLLRVWFILTFLISIYGLYQLFARSMGWPFAELALSNPTIASHGVQTYRSLSGFSEISSVFKEPGWLGDYLLKAIIFFGLIILNKQGSRFLFSSRFLNIFFLITFLVTLFFTGALGATLFFLIDLGVIFYFGVIPRKRLLKVILTGGAVIAISVSVLPLFSIDIREYASKRLSGFFQSVSSPQERGKYTSFSTRLSRSLGTLDVWRNESPIVGVGLNGLGYYSPEYVEDPRNIGKTNSGWVLLLTEVGILGCLAMVIIIASMFYSLWKRARNQNLAPGWNTLLMAAGWMIVFDALSTLVTFTYTNSLRWFTLGLANLILIESRRRIIQKTIPNPHIHQVSTPKK